ncbi:hypothetical protein ACB092_06G045000, partial [Castanea dentata]
MSNLAKLKFNALDISGKNYLSWVLNVEIHLKAMALIETIKDASSQNKAKAMIFIRHHLHKELKTEYVTEKDPLVLWNKLKQRYEHYKSVILPKADYEWIHLRLQDFKSVSEYKSALFKITSQLKLCGEKQYREHKFKKYSELISCILVAEQNNELLLKNHQSHPTSSTPFSKVNGVSFERNGGNKSRGRGRGRGNNNQNRGRYTHNLSNGHTTPYKRKWSKQESGKGLQNKPSKFHEDICFRCGMKGHWSRTCRTPKHLVD